MIKIEDEGIILKPQGQGFESASVFNPACIEVDGITHMFYRACDKHFVSKIGYCQLKDNKLILRADKPIIYPESDNERAGTEDPRIVLFEGKYYLFYTSFDGMNAQISYAVSKDLTDFKKKGIISPSMSYDKAEDMFRNSGVRERYSLFEMYYKDQRGKDVWLWEKDAFIFPKRIKGKIALMHRILPGMQIAYFNDFTELTPGFWSNYLKELGKHVVLDPHYYYESRNVGGGAPPIETEDGWLLIYHAVEETPTGRIYHAAAALLDLENPNKLIGKLKEPLFSPKAKWEKKGIIENVVFPTGTIINKDRLFIYYGAADTVIGAKSLKISDLLKELKKSKV